MSQEIETLVSENAPFHSEMENSGRQETISEAEVRPFDFENPAGLPPRDWKRLQNHQEAFAKKAASVFAARLHAECSFKLASTDWAAGRSLVNLWPKPCHLALFKLEPLRGVALVEFTSQLGSGMIERLLGGQGTGSEEAGPLSDVEVVLFEQISQMFASEWSAHWAGLVELKPVLLGYESNRRFRQVAAPQGRMLAIAFDVTAGPCSGQIHFALRFDSMEPLIKKLGGESVQKPATATQTRPEPAPVESFDRMPVSITAEWPATELSARDILALKVGDVLRMGSECAEGVQVRLADQLKFQGRPGTLAGQWAVELTRLIV